MKRDPGSEAGAAFRIVAIYCVFATAWIYLSDSALSLVVRDTAHLVRLSIYKGVFFIIVTAALLFHLIRRHIAKLYEAKRSLRESESRFRQLVESTPLPLCFADQNGAITFFNERFGQVFGYSRDEIPTVDAWWRLAYPDEQYRKWVVATWEDAVRKARNHQTDIERIEYRVTCRDGTVRRMEISGAIVGESLLATFFDVTERRRAEELLLTTADRSRKLFEAMTSGITTYRSDDGEHFFISGMNPAGEAMTGVSAGDVIGREVREVFPGVAAMGLFDIFRRVRATGTAEILPAVRYRDERLDLWYENRVFGISGDEIAALFDDVTPRKNAEEALRALNEELEERVMQRTSEYEEVNRELESFNYSVSHDLRAPLRHIDSYTSIFSEEYGDLVPPEGREYLERIIWAARKMATLIEAMLNLSRINRSSLSMEDLDLSRMVTDISAVLMEGAPDRKVAFSIEPDVHVHGDAQMFRVILDNLIGNAWKYSARTDHAEIAFGTRIMDGATVCFVRDNGAGFDMAYADKLFGAFQRLHAASEFEGTGIGLATVQRLIHRHGGRIWAEGAPGQGATFYFTVGGGRPGSEVRRTREEPR